MEERVRRAAKHEPRFVDRDLIVSGRQVALIKSINTIISPGFTYPFYSPPVYGLVPFLFVRGANESQSHTLARYIVSAGWLVSCSDGSG